MIVKKNPDEFQHYLSDASNYSGAAEAVYLPENELDIIALVKKFNHEKKQITIAGNGTGLTGARVPRGGVVISMEKLNNILAFNAADPSLRVQPGMIFKDLQDYVEAHRLFYPPDPTERNCFIGATVAANASGARSFKYGSTRDYVTGMKMVLPSGETLSLTRGQIVANAYGFSFATDQGTRYNFTIPHVNMPNTKNASGYYCKRNMDLIDLFIGSEGTLGIMTELTLRLLPMTDHILSCVVFFDQEEDALNFIDEARALTRTGAAGQNSEISARGLEFFNKFANHFLRPDYPAIPENTCAVWFEQELPDRDHKITEAWLQLIRKHHADADKTWLAVGSRAQERMKEFRHAISWKVNDYVARRGLRKVGTDVAVPVESFRSFYRWMIDLMEQQDIPYVSYGHFGNCHPHLNMLPADQRALIKATTLYAEICREAVRLKGTVSAEHGIGKLKREYLLMMYGEEVIRQMARLKLEFDPNKIFNIGNIFEEKYLHRTS